MVSPLTTATQRRQRSSRFSASSSVLEQDREFVAHAGGDPDDAGDRGEEREKPEDFRGVEAGEERRGQNCDGLSGDGTGDELEDVSGEGKHIRGI